MMDTHTACLLGTRAMWSFENLKTTKMKWSRWVSSRVPEPNVVAAEPGTNTFVPSLQ